MPEISRFYGVVIKMHFNEHNPPHFHAEYGEYEALININSMGIISGKLPARVLGMVVEWASINQSQLKQEWNKARNMESLSKIAPLE